ncbi:MAG: peptidoglycan editing factor PgeF [Acidimicrobiia bacterium]
MTLPSPDRAFRWSREPWGDALRCIALDPHAQHLFTSRQLSLPDPDSWARALASLGAPVHTLMRVKQVHGNAVRVLMKGRVPADAHDQRPDGDAVVSNEPGLVLAVLVADCVPLLVCDPVGGAAAAIHAGWRGTCARIAHTAIESMVRHFGTNPADLRVAIGPSAGPQDYVVGDSLVAAFLEAGHPRPEVDRWFSRSDGQLRLDLWAANTQQLVDAGVAPGNIFVSGLSTMTHPGIFDSYRVDGERAGRMAGVIVVPQPK